MINGSMKKYSLFANTKYFCKTNVAIAVTEYLMKFKYTDGTNIMGLVVFSTVLGITLGKMGKRGKPLLDFFTSLSEAMMIITNWVVW